MRASRKERRVKDWLPSLVVLLSANHARNILVDTYLFLNDYLADIVPQRECFYK